MLHEFLHPAERAVRAGFDRRPTQGNDADRAESECGELQLRAPRPARQEANCDRFDLIDKKQITNNVRFTAMMLYALAEADELPVKKLNDQQTKEFLIKQNLKNELIIGKDWRWEL